ncbi:MAG: FtsK/SpoIIIE domain-containing protein, partial [Actinomyces sp.]|nr:FtsK/SpoIIIE domain-containing protein [Actinomyces sp.]
MRSIVMALSLTHTPKEVQFFVIDFSGTFAAFEGAAHVAGVASREDEDILNRMVSEIEGII